MMNEIGKIGSHTAVADLKNGNVLWDLEIWLGIVLINVSLWFCCCRRTPNLVN